MSLSRCGWAVLAVSSAAVLGLSRHLQPSPLGYGTHMQLGLPPCGFNFLLGIACPGCGLTTSFACLARGQIAAAVQANPLGVPLFALTALVLPLALMGIFTNRRVSEALVRMRADRIVIVLAVAMLVVWGVRLLRFGAWL